MIRFTCKHCQRTVQIAADSAGKQGRCPLCKNLVRIPLSSEPSVSGAGGAGNLEAPSTDDLRALKAAILHEKLPEATRPVPPPPQTLQQPEEIQLFLNDSGQKTSEMPAMHQPQPTVVQPEKQPAPPRPIRPGKSRFGLQWIVLAVGIVVIAMAIVMVVVAARRR